MKLSTEDRAQIALGTKILCNVCAIAYPPPEISNWWPSFAICPYCLMRKVDQERKLNETKSNGL